VRNRTSQRGFFILDAVIGLAVIVTVAIVVAVLVSEHARASKQLDQRVAAVRTAERVLTDMQLGLEGAWKQQLGSTILIEPAIGGKAPAQTLWVTVTVRYDAGEVSLVGLARTDAAPGGGR